MSATSQPTSPTAPDPTACPFCRSAQISTTSKTTGADTYWRCTGCGQIWNPSRLVAPRYGWTR